MIATQTVCSWFRFMFVALFISSFLKRTTAFSVRPIRPQATRLVKLASSSGALSPDDIIDMQKTTSNATPYSSNEAAYLNHQRQVFDEMSDFFGSNVTTPPEVIPVMRHLAHSILSKFTNQPTTKLMDVGCGTGALFPFYIEAARDLNTTLAITGVDLSPKMAALARQRANSLLSDEDGETTIKVVDCDFVTLIREHGGEYRDSYDAVVANACFGNFLDTDTILTAMTDCLKVGGTLFITHPLGASFVEKLHKEDPATVPHLLPTRDELEAASTTRPLQLTDWQEVDDNGNPLYLAGATKTPYQPLPQVLRFRGTVDSGYGRGGKKLGFPTANLPESLFYNALESISTGVYFGWAVVEGRDGIHKAAVNVGYSPTFEGKENKEKIIEAHLITDDDEPLEDFYNKSMRLALSGFLRPEQKFDSFPGLMAAITRDVGNAKQALTVEPYVSLRSDAFLVDSNQEWVGSSGGDATASWEFQDFAEALSRSKS